MNILKQFNKAKAPPFNGDYVYLAERIYQRGEDYEKFISSRLDSCIPYIGYDMLFIIQCKYLGRMIDGLM